MPVEDRVAGWDGIAVWIVSPVIIEPARRRNIASGMDQPQHPSIRDIL
jgi:hypothetical protein